MSPARVAALLTVLGCSCAGERMLDIGQPSFAHSVLFGTLVELDRFYAAPSERR